MLIIVLGSLEVLAILLLILLMISLVVAMLIFIVKRLEIYNIVIRKWVKCDFGA